jgi:Zn-finger nucleic acid-binding protein
VLSAVLVACPACADSSLVEFEARDDVRVEFCQSCKGMLVDELALEQLTGTNDVESLSDPCEDDGGLRPCLRCNTQNWQRRLFESEGQTGLGLCGTCGMVWFDAGGLERLRERLLSERRRAMPAPSLPAPAEVREERADRISFEGGIANLAGVPVALVLGLAFCSNPVGQFFAGLIGMPFHELGHALTSWLSSRFAVPLPFFTVWHDEQSLLFGFLLAALLAWFGHHSWRDESRFGVALAGVLLLAQVGMSWLVPARFTLMLQILGGALGELVLGALLLAAFHFPLPDRLRWDFWRWPALFPGAVCFGQALLVWIRASDDAGSIPWGAAIGDESDGDMNRLVRDFGWSASELASFYLKAGLLSALGFVAAYALAWRRHLELRAARGSPNAAAHCATQNPTRNPTPPRAPRART